MKTDPITLEHLRKILHYDPASGRFTWLRATSWRVRVGAVAGSVNKRLGYVVIGIGGVTYYAHRLAWLYVHGEMPSDQIDHIDGDRANNALVNLRKASMSDPSYGAALYNSLSVPQEYAAALADALLQAS